MSVVYVKATIGKGTPAKSEKVEGSPSRTEIRVSPR
jgi:hypothetical protein